MTLTNPFSALIPETELDAFMAQDYERRPCFFDRSSAATAGFSLEQFMTMLRDTVWHNGELSFVPSELNQVSPDHWSKMVDASGTFSVDKIKAARMTKTTLKVRAIQRRHQGLRLLIHDLSKSGALTAGANAYYTPAGAQGFVSHWDVHDVFVLQISGAKEWHISRTVACPGAYDRREFLSTRDAPLDAPEVRVLKAGELLYIPRGFAHYACALDQDSLHITISIEQILWVEVLHALIDRLALENESLRESASGADFASFTTPAAARETATLKAAITAISEEDLAAAARQIAQDRARNSKIGLGQVFGDDPIS